MEQNVGCVSHLSTHGAGEAVWTRVQLPASGHWQGGAYIHPEFCCPKRERAAYSCCLPANTNASLASAALGWEEPRAFSLLPGFPTNHCVPDVLFTLPLLAVPGTAFSGFSAFVLSQSPSSPLPPPRLDLGSGLYSVYWAVMDAGRGAAEGGAGSFLIPGSSES